MFAFYYRRDTPYFYPDFFPSGSHQFCFHSKRFSCFKTFCYIFINKRKIFRHVIFTPFQQRRPVADRFFYYMIYAFRPFQIVCIRVCLPSAQSRNLLCLFQEQFTFSEYFFSFFPFCYISYNAGKIPDFSFGRPVRHEYLKYRYFSAFCGKYCCFALPYAFLSGAGHGYLFY